MMGRRQVGKAQDFGSCIRRFESSRLSWIFDAKKRIVMTKFSMIFVIFLIKSLNEA